MNKNIDKRILINNNNDKFFIIIDFRLNFANSSARTLLPTGKRLRDSVNPLSISEKEIRGKDGGSGYGRVGFVGTESCERRKKGSKIRSPHCGSYSLYKGEDFYREPRIEGSWDVIGSNCYANKTDWRSNFRHSLAINNNGAFE